VLDSAAGKPAPITRAGNRGRRRGALRLRKIWLPKLLYDALPWFYLFSGAAAFLATLYISDWFWVLPHYLLFSAACLHLSVYVFRRRFRTRRDSCDDCGP